MNGCLQNSSDVQTPILEPEVIRLPTAVDRVIYERQNRLSQVRAIVAGAYAIAEANDDSNDVRYALEVALDLFNGAIESLEPLQLCRDASQEMSHA